MSSCRNRATRSTAPPAANGTMILIGRDGQFSAYAADGNETSAVITPNAANTPAIIRAPFEMAGILPLLRFYCLALVEAYVRHWQRSTHIVENGAVAVSTEPP